MRSRPTIAALAAVVLCVAAPAAARPEPVGGGRVEAAGLSTPPVGFRWEPGWEVESTGPVPIASHHSSVTWAANVPFAADDVLDLRERNGAGWFVPWDTIGRLGHDGMAVVVQVASAPIVLRRPDLPWYLDLEAPFGLEFGSSQSWSGTAAPPPLPHHRLLARARGWYLDIRVFLGVGDPHPDQLAAADRAVQRMIVPAPRPGSNPNVGLPLWRLPSPAPVPRDPSQVGEWTDARGQPVPDGSPYGEGVTMHSYFGSRHCWRHQYTFLDVALPLGRSNRTFWTSASTSGTRSSWPISGSGAWSRSYPAMPGPRGSVTVDGSCG